MRFLVEATIPTARGNDLVRTGQLGTVIETLVAGTRPEACYFTDDGGRRCAVLVVDLESADQLPGLVEPWFLALEVEVRIRLVMVPEDLAKAAPGIEAAAKA